MKHPFLTQLGISAAEQVRGPDPNRIPQGFNQYAAMEWRSAVTEVIKIRDDTVVKHWAKVIAKFLKLCETNGVFGFANTGEGRNSFIEDLLVKARTQFVRFCTKVGFLNDVKIRTTTREVVMTEQGPVLRAWANCTVKDPLFVEWLQKLPKPYQWPHVSTTANNYFEYHASPELTIWIRRDPRQVVLDKYKVGYDIHLPCWPSIPGNPMPSEKEIESFLIDVLWLPLLRAMRPKFMDHRLI